MIPKSLSPRAMLSLGVILLLVAGALRFLDVRTLQLQNRAAAVYVPVDGTVVSTLLRHHRRNRGSGETWSPHIVYRYTVGGRSYENDVYAHDLVVFREKAIVQQMLDALPVGGPIRVHYDPDAPASSVLSTVPASTAGMWFPWLPGLGGVLFLGLAFRRSRPAEPGGARRWTSS